jgi:hypothetical protein
MSSNVAVASKELNFASKREQAISASSARLDVPSSNGTSFFMGQTIDLRLPSGMTRGSYLDFENSYAKMTIFATRPGDGATNNLSLARNGIYNIISKVEILSSSSTISVIENYNALVNLFLDSEASTEYKKTLGNAQFGCSGGTDVTGDALVVATGSTDAKTTTYCIPLILTPLWSSSKYLPLFHQDNITIRLTLDSFDNAFISGTAATEINTNLVIQTVSMVCNVVTLDPSAQNMIDQSNGGVYTMILDDWRSSRGGTIQTGQRLINQNLGFSHQSLSRVIFAFYLANGKAVDGHGARPNRHVSEYAFQMNGRSYPAQKIKASSSTTKVNISEPVAEIRASTRQSGDFGQPNDITGAQFAADAAGGRAFYEIDLESLRSESDSIYSGLYTVGATTSLEVSMDADGAAENQLSVWGQYQGALKLDTNTTNTFTYSV